MPEFNPKYRGDFFHDGNMPGNLLQQLERGKPSALEVPDNVDTTEFLAGQLQQQIDQLVQPYRQYYINAFAEPEHVESARALSHRLQEELHSLDLENTTRTLLLTAILDACNNWLDEHENDDEEETETR